MIFLGSFCPVSFLLPYGIYKDKPLCLSKVSTTTSYRSSPTFLLGQHWPDWPCLFLLCFCLFRLGKHSIYRVRFKLARFPLITSCWRAEPSRSHGKQGVIKRLLYQWKKKHKQKHKDENKTNEPLPLRYRGTPMNKDEPDCQACARTHALSLFSFFFGHILVSFLSLSRFFLSDASNDKNKASPIKIGLSLSFSLSLGYCFMPQLSRSSRCWLDPDTVLCVHAPSATQ